MSRQDEWNTMGSCHDMWETFTIILIANKFKLKQHNAGFTVKNDVSYRSLFKLG